MYRTIRCSTAEENFWVFTDIINNARARLKKADQTAAGIKWHYDRETGKWTNLSAKGCAPSLIQ